MSPKEVLSKFDLLTVRKFDEHDLSTELNKLRDDGTTEVSPELLAEAMAFAFQERNSEDESYFVSMMTFQNEDGSLTEYPSIEKVTPDMILYWTRRAMESVNPILVSRYSGLVWEFQNKVIETRPSHELCRLNIKAILDMAKGDYIKRDVYILKKLERALGLAIEISDNNLVQECKSEILIAEKKLSEDSKPGLWGYAFDLLVDNKKVKLTTQEETEIIHELENKLQRLTAAGPDKKIDPWAAEAAATRLAAYYKKRQKEPEVRRVIMLVGSAFKNIESDGSMMQVSGWIEHVRKLYLRFNYNEEAEQLLKRIREIGPSVASELTPIGHSFEISKEDLDEYASGILLGPTDEIIKKIAVAHIPKKEEVKNQILEMSKESPLIYMMGHDLQDEKGRTVAKIGSLKDDLEGHIVRQVSENLTFLSIFLRHILKEANQKTVLNTESVMEFIKRTPIVDPDRYPIVEKGIDSYFKGDYLVATHLLIPQIEEAIRNLIEHSGGIVLKATRGGGHQLKTFDDLLRDPILEKGLGEDFITYFRILFTDPRGWNLRNIVSHGLARPQLFNHETADRLFHAMLCLGLIKEQSKEVIVEKK